jgi:hypothetical protein
LREKESVVQHADSAFQSSIDANENTLIYFGAMPSATQKKILEGLFHAMKPLARAMLRSGIGYRDFAEIAKSAFVNVATTDYGIRGRPTNASRVAVMTGLTRKEVKRLRDIKDGGSDFVIGKELAPGLVLGNWFSHSEFTDSNGDPLELDFQGDKPSFCDLVRQFGGDIPPGAMRTELLRIGAIEETKSGKLRALKSVFTPSDLDDRLALALELSLRRLAETILFNTDPDNQELVRIERTITTRLLAPEHAELLRRVSRGRLEEFGNSIHEFFSTYESLHAETDGLGSRAVGVGIYYYEEASADEESA